VHTGNPSLLLDLEIKKRGGGSKRIPPTNKRVMVNPFSLLRQKVIFMRRIFVSLTDVSLTGKFTMDL